MLELKVASNDVTNGNLAVAWCVDEETIKKLSDQRINDPQVVIVVAPTTNYHVRREYRKVVPLKDLMTYLEFRAAGENKIWAFISTKSKKDARNYYLTKEDGEFKTDILDRDGNAWSAIFTGRYVNQEDNGVIIGSRYVYTPDYASEAVTVNVPTGVFAKEPAKWEKTWVNHWFRTKSVDQCDFRRRRMLAYTVQPLVVLLDVLVPRLLMLLVSTLWLSRGMTLKYLLHPLSYNTLDASDVFKGGTWTIAHLSEDEKSNDPEITFSYVVRKLWKMPLMPVVLFPLYLMVHFHVVLWVLGITAGIVAAVILVMAIVDGFFSGALDSLQRWLESFKTTPTPWYMDAEELEAITCNKNFQQRTSVSALPAKHRTINLRFQDLKSRVCRPFSA